MMCEFAPTKLTDHPNFLAACGLTETAFLDAICDILKTAFGANTAFIASFGLVEADYLIIEAHSERDEDLKSTHFYASQTPCGDAINSAQPIHVAGDVCTAYPNATILKKLGAEACTGLPLQRADGTAIGMVVLEWSQPVALASLQMVIDALAPFVGRIVEELQRKTLAHVIPTLVNPITPWAHGDPTKVFRDIAQQAAELTNVNSVVIVHRTADGSEKFRILAVTSNSDGVQDIEGMVVNYLGIPCSNMIQNDLYLETSGTLDRYPDMPLLKQLEVESYLGFGFRNTAGETIGHIAFLHNRPMRASVADCDVIRVIAARAGQELQHYTLEREKEAINKALRVRSKLESLGTMSGTIAHDFNNQLTAMIGNAELAGLEMRADHPAREFLKNAEESMWRARDVITEIMDFAGNSRSAPLEQVALGEVVTSAISEFTPRLEGDSRIVSEIAPDLPLIESRRMQIFQILTNLITNGLDALSDGETHNLRVVVDTVDLSRAERERCLTGQCATLPAKCLRVELRDSGRGMDAETLERIFDPYFSTKGVSRGLGLSSVLGIAKRLGIGLTCSSEVGIGTAFQLFFAPHNTDDTPERDEQDPSRVPAVEAQQSKTALVVDDDTSVNTVVTKMLTLWGWQVITAHSGEEALKLAKSNGGIDFAIVDVVMAGISGIETLQELRRELPKLPAIIVSGYSEDNLFSTFKNDEDIKFLVKPFGAEMLKSAIEELQCLPAS